PAAVGLLLPPPPRRQPAGHRQAAERVFLAPDLRDVLRRRRRCPQLRLGLWGRQPDVVERLSAPELDVAELAPGDRARPGPPVRRGPDEARLWQRLPALRTA